MKTNNTKKNSATKKLIPAVSMLTVSAMMLSTATYAWFTMNKKVEVTGMQMKTTVDSNLLIADDTLGSNAKKADNLFTTAKLEQENEKILEPVSTATGKEFYYTVNALANGDAAKEEYTLYGSEAALTGADATAYLDAFNKAYGLTKSEADGIIANEEGAVPYVDYVFQLKADNTTSNAQYINLTKLDLAYDNANTEQDTAVAYRAAVFVNDITTGTVPTDGGTLLGLYKPSGATNFTDSTKTVSGAAAVAGTPTYITTATSWATVPQNSTKYYKVVVRFYIEGEDTTCYSANFMNLVGEWALDLSLELQDTQNSGVAAISLTTPTP